MATKRVFHDEFSEDSQKPATKKQKRDESKDQSNINIIQKRESKANKPENVGKVYLSCDGKNKNEMEVIPMKTFAIGKNKSGSYKYIDSEDKFSTVIEDLRKEVKGGQSIAVDCEGVTLSRFGSVTMVNIAVRDLVYLIDVQVIGNIVFDRGLRSILEDDSVEKLMFDCREDADALFHLHNVKLNGVLDVQLMEVMKRGLDRRRRTKIRSLKHCLELYVRDNTLLSLKLQGRVEMSASNNIWEKRPISENMLKYASIDVLSLFKLYDDLRFGVDLRKWRVSSKRYCDYQRSRNRHYRDGDGFLPAGIL